MGSYSIGNRINKEFVAVSVVPCWLFQNNLLLVVVNIHPCSSAWGVHAVFKQAKRLLSVYISCARHLDARRTSLGEHIKECASTYCKVSVNYSPALQSHPLPSPPPPNRPLQFYVSIPSLRR